MGEFVTARWRREEHGGDCRERKKKRGVGEVYGGGYRERNTDRRKRARGYFCYAGKVEGGGVNGMRDVFV